MTSYVILLRFQRDPSANECWEEVGREEAGSPATAIRKLLSRDERGGGTFQAVPVRNWRPMTMSVEQVRKVSLVGEKEVAE